jgi:hypothetical protein
VLLGQHPCEGDAAHVALSHEDLPQELSRSPLLREGALELCLLEKILLDEQGPERAPREVGLIHRWKYRLAGDRAKCRFA